MIFNSLEFVLFFAFVYLVYRSITHKAQNIFLLLASYVFYGCWDWRFLFLLFFTTVVDYICAQKVTATDDPKRRKQWLLLSVGINLCVLGFFKYFNFFAGSLSGLFQTFGVHLDPFVLTVVLPVGVSFYTFQSISYIVDVYRKNVAAERDFLIYALFVSFFPQLVAGPIERAAHMLPQYRNPRTITPQKDQEGIWFILWGFFLKVFVADNLARLVGIVFDQKGAVPGIEVLLGSYAFAFQIFGDFAGYSFIAMGLARLMGFELMANFLYPYFVTNPRDFWRHWHISLSQWLRDYLYVPLGGNRGGEGATYRNLLVTMFLGGLWHGAAWTFGIWGLYQGGLLCAHRWLTRHRQKADASASSGWIYALKMLGMFQLTCLGWLIFRATSLSQLSGWMGGLLGDFSGHSPKAPYLLLQLVFYILPVLFVQMVQKNNDLAPFVNARGIWPWVIYALMFYLFVLFGEFGGQEFIYFQF